PTYAWSREAHKDGSGQHMHMLIHIPARHRSHFEDTAIGWFDGPGEMDVRPAHQAIRFTDNGKRLSAIGYIAKQMSPQAWYKRGLIRSRTPGLILGKRGGVTINLSQKAIDAFWQDHRGTAPLRE